MWALDFRFDSTTDGNAVKVLDARRAHRRGSQLDIAEYSITSERVANKPERVFVTASDPPLVLRGR